MKTEEEKKLRWRYDEMKQRCYNPNNKSYNNYGGRGITVCDEWRNSFRNFYQWAMQSGFSIELTIDRTDNDGPYAPDNCKWITQSQQMRNTRANITDYKKGTRVCFKCGLKKKLDEFGKDPFKGRFGHRYMCTECRLKYTREYYQKNKEKINKKRRERRRKKCGHG